MKMKPTEVWMDFHRRSYLKVGEGKKKTYFVAMRAAGVTVVSLTDKEIDEWGMTPIEYSLTRATNLFREAARDYGATKQAKKALRVRPRSNPKLQALRVWGESHEEKETQRRPAPEALQR